jgi:hypothetical protein
MKCKYASHTSALISSLTRKEVVLAKGQFNKKRGDTPVAAEGIARSKHSGAFEYMMVKVHGKLFIMIHNGKAEVLVRQDSRHHDNEGIRPGQKSSRVERRVTDNPE